MFSQSLRDLSLEREYNPETSWELQAPSCVLGLPVIISIPVVKYNFYYLCGSLQSLPVEISSLKSLYIAFSEVPEVHFQKQYREPKSHWKSESNFRSHSCNYTLFHSIQMFSQMRLCMFTCSWDLGISFLQTILNLKAGGNSMAEQHIMPNFCSLIYLLLKI